MIGTAKAKDITNIRNKAISYFRSIKRIKSPAFNKDVKITPSGFSHIEMKDTKHRRDNDEIYMRYLCFLSIEKILCHTEIYQEYKALTEDIEVERNGQFISEKKMVQYYGFVGIVQNGENKHRIRVVVKEVHGWNSIEFVSVMPARKMKGYNNFFGPEI